MRTRLGITLVFAAAACGNATLGGSGDDTDAAVSADARNADSMPADAAVDAKACTGGDQAQSAPDASCLVLFMTPVTYVEAQTACQGLGGHLAYLKDASLDTFAETFIGTLDTWIGGTDIVTEMSFVWDDGTPFNFTNWHTGEPNNGGTGATYQEDCAIIAGSRVGKQWDDRPCDDSVVTTSGKFATLCQY